MCIYYKKKITLISNYFLRESLGILSLQSKQRIKGSRL